MCIIYIHILGYNLWLFVETLKPRRNLMEWRHLYGHPFLFLSCHGQAVHTCLVIVIHRISQDRSESLWVQLQFHITGKCQAEKITFLFQETSTHSKLKYNKIIIQYGMCDTMKQSLLDQQGDICDLCSLLYSYSKGSSNIVLCT